MQAQSNQTDLIICIIRTINDPVLISLLNASVDGDLLVTAPPVELGVVNVQVLQVFRWFSKNMIGLG